VPDEVAALDAGTPPGWTRTGFAFSVGADPASGTRPVCRFFSAAFAPKSSHFYTPFDAECASLRAGTTWSFESIPFYLVSAEEQWLYDTVGRSPNGLRLLDLSYRSVTSKWTCPRFATSSACCWGRWPSLRTRQYRGPLPPPRWR